MKSSLIIATCLLCTASNAHAANFNWADSVVEYSDNIQNFGGSPMTDDTTNWLTGAPDSDPSIFTDYFPEGDTIAGWRASNPDEFFILNWNTGLTDNQGDDITVFFYGGGKSSISIYASTDNQSYTKLDTFKSPGSGLNEMSFDDDNQFDNDVHYIKFVREAATPKSGFFVDAVGGILVPEPASISLIAFAGLTLLRRKRANS